MADPPSHHEFTLPIHSKPGVQQDTNRAQGGDGGTLPIVTPSQHLESDDGTSSLRDTVNKPVPPESVTLSQHLERDDGTSGLQEKAKKPVSLEPGKAGGSPKEKVDNPKSLAATHDESSLQSNPKKAIPFSFANKPADWSPTESELEAIMSGQAGDKRGPHQDYIVRQRYDNKLPPPPGSVKLLPLQGDREALDQYTLPTYGGRLARQQPINIDADALGGMDINLVGMPGIFEGDESCKFLGLSSVLRVAHKFSHSSPHDPATSPSQGQSPPTSAQISWQAEDGQHRFQLPAPHAVRRR